MTAEQIRRLRKSFRLLEREAEVAAPLFYQQLLVMNPELKPLFKTDVELQALKLMQMLGGVLDLLDYPLEMEATLEELGARHAGYGVRPRHYSAVGTALIGMLERVLTVDFTAETRQAWVALYHLVAGKMLGGAAHAPC